MQIFVKVRCVRPRRVLSFCCWCVGSFWAEAPVRVGPRVHRVHALLCASTCDLLAYVRCRGLAAARRLLRRRDCPAESRRGTVALRVCAAGRACCAAPLCGCPSPRCVCLSQTAEAAARAALRCASVSGVGVRHMRAVVCESSSPDLLLALIACGRCVHICRH
jgi:hypothetical protein